MMNEWNEMDFENHPRTGVILSVLRLSRALRRCPPEEREDRLPPAMGRLLACVGAHSGVSSRDLCELLDLRPSSLSEMLSRGEEDGLLARTADENDRRIQHIRLTEKGEALAERREASRRADEEEKTACFTEEEARRFCELSQRLAAHLESVGADKARRCPPPPFRGEEGPMSFDRGGRPGCPPLPPGHRRPGRPAPEQGGQETSPEPEQEGRFPKGARFRC